MLFFFKCVSELSNFLADSINLLPGPRHPARKYVQCRLAKKNAGINKNYGKSFNPERATQREREKRRNRF